DRGPADRRSGDAAVDGRTTRARVVGLDGYLSGRGARADRPNDASVRGGDRSARGARAHAGGWRSDGVHAARWSLRRGDAVARGRGRGPLGARRGGLDCARGSGARCSFRRALGGRGGAPLVAVRRRPGAVTTPRAWPASWRWGRSRVEGVRRWLGWFDGRVWSPPLRPDRVG